MLTVAAVAVALYAGFVGALYGFQRNLLYLPAPAGPSPEAVGLHEVREVTVETPDGLRLLAWHRRPARPDGLTILYFHGNAGHLAARAHKIRPLLEAGHGILLLAWRGYGGNPGSPTEQGLYHDGRAALAWLREAGYEAGRVILYGESLGSGVAVQMATEFRPAAVILEAPFSSIGDIAAARYPFVPVRPLLKDRFDSVAKIHRVEAPILVLHGERDGVVPYHFGRKLYGQAVAPKYMETFPEARHDNLYDHGAGEASLRFIADLEASPAHRR